MDELPQPDVMDRAGRLRRLVVALIVGITVGSLAFGALYALARPDEVAAAHHFPAPSYTSGPWKFVGYFTFGAGFGAFIATLAVLNHFARRRSERERVPTARQVS
jgi:hypothetical protein